MLGYGAEMWLKAGYFKLRGLVSIDPVTIDIAKRDAEAHGWAAPKTMGHDLDWWLKGIDYQRTTRGLSPLAATWTNPVAAVATHWNVGMRYVAARRSEADALAVLGHVSWIEKHHTDLWR